MKYSEAEKQIKALSNKYDIDKSWGFFEVIYNKKNYVISVSVNNEYGLRVRDINKFSSMPFSDKLYMILAELAMTPLDERVEEKKYYVKIFNNEFGYLNIDISTGNMMVYDGRETDFIKTKFTNKAIKQLKQRDDLPLNWNKVIFKEAK